MKNLSLTRLERVIEDLKLRKKQIDEEIALIGSGRAGIEVSASLRSGDSDVALRFLAQWQGHDQGRPY